MGVSGHLHVLAACLLKWNTPYSLNRSLDFHQNQYGHFGQDKNVLLLLDVESCFLTEYTVPSSAGSRTMILYWLCCPSFSWKLNCDSLLCVLSKLLLKLELWFSTDFSIPVSAGSLFMIPHWLCYTSLCWKVNHDPLLTMLCQLLLEVEP